jgi:hypothetical protein
MTNTIALVSGLLDAHNRRDTERLAAHYQPEATVHLAEWPEPISAAAWIGAATQLVESFPDLTFTRGRIATADSLMMFEVQIAGTNDGPLHLNDIDRLILQTEAKRLLPTGRTMSIDGVVVLEIAAGLITVERHFLHLAETHYQLGLVSGAMGRRRVPPDRDDRPPASKGHEMDRTFAAVVSPVAVKTGQPRQPHSTSTRLARAKAMTRGLVPTPATT